MKTLLTFLVLLALASCSSAPRVANTRFVDKWTNLTPGDSIAGGSVPFAGYQKQPLADSDRAKIARLGQR